MQIWSFREYHNRCVLWLSEMTQHTCTSIALQLAVAWLQLQVLHRGGDVWRRTGPNYFVPAKLSDLQMQIGRFTKNRETAIRISFQRRRVEEGIGIQPPSRLDCRLNRRRQLDPPPPTAYRFRVFGSSTHDIVGRSHLTILWQAGPAFLQ